MLEETNEFFNKTTAISKAKGVPREYEKICMSRSEVLEAVYKREFIPFKDPYMLHKKVNRRLKATL